MIVNCLVPLIVAYGSISEKPTTININITACKFTTETLHSWVEVKAENEKYSARITYNHYLNKDCLVVKTKRYVDDIKGNFGFLDRLALNYYDPEGFLNTFMQDQCKQEVI